MRKREWDGPERKRIVSTSASDVPSNYRCIERVTPPWTCTGNESSYQEKPWPRWKNSRRKGEMKQGSRFY